MNCAANNPNGIETGDDLHCNGEPQARIHESLSPRASMDPPVTFVYLEHDGKVLLVAQKGTGPQKPTPGRTSGKTRIRLPTTKEVQFMGIGFRSKGRVRIEWGDTVHIIERGYPKIDWPEGWAWKDRCMGDNGVDPVARECIYRSLHRLVSKVIVHNEKGEVLMAQAERGHFTGHWTLPGGYMDHNEHPSVGCVREALEELGLNLELSSEAPVITQRIFNDDSISFVSFTYDATWNGEADSLELLDGEISAARWFPAQEALIKAVSQFDQEALQAFVNR